MLLLKFISWNDRPTDRPHDAEDAKYILDIYWDIEETQDLVYDGTCSDLLNADPFIPEIAAAYVIARQMRQQFSNETLAYLTKILRDQARRSILLPQMQFNSPNQALAEQQLNALIEELTK